MQTVSGQIDHLSIRAAVRLILDHVVVVSLLSVSKRRKLAAIMLLKS
jgi:hypothetical protein